MALEIPETAEQVINRALTDIQRELPTSNPRLKNSWLLALATADSNAIFDFYLQLNEAIKQNFPDTATGVFLERWAAIFGIQRLSATQANGNCAATGTATTVIPSGTTLIISGNTYTSTGSATISAQSISVTGIVRSGTTATATTASNHNLANNVPVTISEAVETDYNLSAVAITVTGLNTFQYQVSGSPSTPATGTILAAFTSASVPIQSDTFGAFAADGVTSLNLDTGTELGLQSPISGVDDTFTVDFGDIGGGTDQETDASLEDRMLDRIQNPVAHFNVSDITAKAKEVAGVTRVFVEEAGTNIGTAAVTSITRSNNIATVTLTVAQDFSSGQLVTILGAGESEYNVTEGAILVQSPTIFHYLVTGTPSTPATGTITSSVSIALGTLRVFFMRDNDDNPIPSGSEVTTVKNKILEINPANTDGNLDLSVLAPTAVATDYTFTALDPNTPTMQTAVIASLDVFYAESTFIGTDIDEDSYRAAIFNTVDTETGDVVKSFELSAPSGDITINSGEIGTRGNAVFS